MSTLQGRVFVEYLGYGCVYVKVLLLAESEKLTVDGGWLDDAAEFGVERLGGLYHLEAWLLHQVATFDGNLGAIGDGVGASDLGPIDDYGDDDEGDEEEQEILG